MTLQSRETRQLRAPLRGRLAATIVLSVLLSGPVWAQVCEVTQVTDTTTGGTQVAATIDGAGTRIAFSADSVGVAVSSDGALAR